MKASGRISLALGLLLVGPWQAALMAKSDDALPGTNGATTAASTAKGVASCVGISFPYTLSGADNTARVAELRQAIECANSEAGAVDIDLGGHTLVFADGPYSDADGPNALPILANTFTFTHGRLEREAAAAPFRFLKAGAGAPLHLLDIQFRNGHSTGDGGAVLADYVFNAGSTRFENNRADGNGGALRLRDPGSNTLLFATDFHGNVATHGAAVSHDGLLTLFHLRIEGNGDADTLSVLHGSTGIGLISVVIADNHLAATGSTLLHYENPTTNRPELRNVTIADNQVAGAAFHVTGNTAIAYNSIVWGNVQGSIGALIANHSIVQGMPGASDPQFLAAAQGNYRLAATSPAIDAGDNAYGFPDFFDLDGDGITAENVPDLDLKPRPVDSPTVPDTGTGTAPLLDLGAYERQNDVCYDFTFPYTLNGADNNARVAELRQAIECANTNSTDDVIDLDGHVLSFIDGPYPYASAQSALPSVSSGVTLRNGELQRDAAAAMLFRFLRVAGGGGALVVDGMTFRGARGSGGGAIDNAGRLTALNSRFIDNQSQVSGAMYEGGAIYSVGALTIRDSRFEDNQGRFGGAIYTRDADIRNSRFIDNRADWSGAIHAIGDLAIVATEFNGNQADWGGALGFVGQADVINSRFLGNTATSNGGAIREADHQFGDLRVVNSLFAGNSVTGDGSIVTLYTGTAELTHITATGNITGTGGTLFGEMYPGFATSPASVRNSILWRNTTVVGLAAVERSIVEGGFPGGTQIVDADPLFVDAGTGDYTLDVHSPAIDAGDNMAVAADAFDANDNSNTTEDTPDLNANPRRYNDTGVSDSGAGSAPIVDMGAYERQTNSPVALPELSIGEVSLDEGHAGTTNFSFTVSLSGPAPASGMSFDIATANGTAIAPGDYIARTLTGQTIPAGSSSYSFVVQVNGDTALEADESFFVNVTNVVGATVLNGQGQGTLRNDDADPCAGFTFPYMLSGADNTARVAELRQAIHCANANATDDVIDLGGFTLLFNAVDADTADTALPEISSGITLRNGTMQRDVAAVDFRLLVVAGNGHLIGESVDFRNGRASIGAAIYNSGELDLENSGFFDNGDIAQTNRGGAIFSSGFTLRIVENRFEHNAAQFGGAVFHDYGDLWLSGSHLENNQAVDGGAIYSLSNMARVYHSDFVANHAQRGGAIVTFGMQVSRSRFERNTATTLGGAVFMEDAITGLHVSNSLLLDNQAADAALIYADGWVSLRNVTISDHVIGAGSNLFAATSGTTLTMVNSIVWGNTGTPISLATISHSLIEGGYPGGTGILDIDPRFVDAADGDFRLASGSPASDAGSNAEVHQDFWMDIDDDGNTSEELDDLDGNPRRRDDTNIVDSGVGASPVVDLGAYERQTDSDPAGITVSPTSGLTTAEAGDTAQFSVVLNTPPMAEVSMALSSSDSTEGMITPSTLSFTAANWNTAQTVTINGIDDAIADGDAAYAVVIAPTSSADLNYSGIDPSDVAVTNRDNESAGITVSPTSGLVTTEAGGTATFTVVLTSEPTADVMMPLASGDATEGTVSPASVTFTTANWNVAQTLTIAGVDDSEVDGNVAYTIDLGPSDSIDPQYDGIVVASITVNNHDDDVITPAVVPKPIPVDDPRALIGLMLAMLLMGSGAVRRQIRLPA